MVDFVETPKTSKRAKYTWKILTQADLQPMMMVFDHTLDMDMGSSTFVFTLTSP